MVDGASDSRGAGPHTSGSGGGAMSFFIARSRSMNAFDCASASSAAYAGSAAAWIAATSLSRRHDDPAAEPAIALGALGLGRVVGDHEPLRPGGRLAQDVPLVAR